MRTLIIVGAIAVAGGCAFSREHQPGAGGDDDGTDPGTGPRGVACDANDPTLRFCVDFEPPFPDVATDLSADGVDAHVIAVGTMDRDDERAAVLTQASTAHVLESGKLNITGNLALDLWIRPMGLAPGPGRYWMLDNHDQYSVMLSDHKVRCVINKDKNVEIAALVDDGNWHHIGCTYDGQTQKVFVDGNLAKCRAETMPISVMGMAGLALGAKLDGSDIVPMYSERYLGGLDNVRVWARSDVDMCAAAGGAGCATACP